MVSGSNGLTLEDLNYTSFGANESDTKTTAFEQSRKYIGQEYDAASQLSYLNARYYDGGRGQFLSQDPVFINLGMDDRTAVALSDPQSLNSYGYAGNNPITNKDPNGDWYKEFITGQQSWGSFQGELGQAANQLSNDSDAWDFAFDHPYVTGAAVGIGSGAAAYAGSAAIANVASRGTASSLSRQILNQRDTLIKNAGGDKQLEGIIKQLYKTSDKFPGGTAGALEREIKTGQLLSKTGHLTKAEQRISQLTKYLKDSNISSKSKQTATKVLKDLQNAVKKANSKTKK
ncbi:MAG: RHS repeat-associated core domain-containing protein [Patescibacteria group bacterium]